MNHKIIFLLLSTFSTISYGQQYDSTYGKYLIVLVETDPWLMVIGSDVPTFALYENGQIIYKLIENEKVKFYEVNLTQTELQKVIQSLKITDELYKLNHIEASDWTDQPTNVLILNFRMKKAISVYGRLKSNGEAREKTPKEFLVVYDNIKNYKNPNAKEWLPNQIEVMFWDYNYAQNKRPWIEGFPDLKSPTTIKINDELYSVFIDKKDFEKFKKYYSSMAANEAIEINGRKMTISYRFPFPNMK